MANSNTTFTELELELSRYLMNLDENEIVSKTITEMATDANMSQSTVYNFVKKIGFNGFQDFKIQVAKNLISENENPDKKLVMSDISKEDSIEKIANKVVHFNQNALESILHFLDETVLSNVLLDLENSDSLHFFGQGGSSVVAYDAYQKFSRSKYRCSYYSDYHIQLMMAAKLKASDCCFVYSHSGNTRETLKIARVLKEKGCTVVAVTGNPNSELVELSDHTLFAFTDEAKFRTESLTSRILYLTIMDIIYTCIMIRGGNENMETINSIRKIVKDTR